MANAFDASSAREGEPTEVVVGDFIQWKRSDLVADYPTDEYTATYVARITGGGESEIQLTMTGQTDHHLVTVTSAESANFSVGDYHWQLEIVQDVSGNRVVVDTGDFKAIPDLDVNQADPRSHAEITLSKIESLIQGKADNDALEYSVAGRSLRKYAFKELLDMREHYRREVRKEKAERDIRQGRGSSATVKVRF